MTRSPLAWPASLLQETLQRTAGPALAHGEGAAWGVEGGLEAAHETAGWQLAPGRRPKLVLNRASVHTVHPLVSHISLTLMSGKHVLT